MTRKSTAPTIFFIVSIIFFVLFIHTVPTNDAFGMGSHPPLVGKIAPEFSLKDLEGQTQRLSEFRGKIVVLTFWATWCDSCTTELPAMQEAYEKFQKQGLMILAVNLLESLDIVREYSKEGGYTFPILLDKGNHVGELFSVYGIPVNVVIDQNGVIRNVIKGELLTKEKIEEIFFRILGE